MKNTPITPGTVSGAGKASDFTRLTVLEKIRLSIPCRYLPLAASIVSVAVPVAVVSVAATGCLGRSQDEQERQDHYAKLQVSDDLPNVMKNLGKDMWHATYSIEDKGNKTYEIVVTLANNETVTLTMKYISDAGDVKWYGADGREVNATQETPRYIQ